MSVYGHFQFVYGQFLKGQIEKFPFDIYSVFKLSVGFIKAALID